VLVKTTISMQRMKDTYANFRALARSEKRGKDFGVRRRRCASTTVVVAPHGGGIEPGTSEIADAIAGANLCFYAFEGIRTTQNSKLHITSTNFDEPRCLALVRKSDQVITIHGEGSKQNFVILGGRDKATIQRLRESLEGQGFCVKLDNPRLPGCDLGNICNRGTQGAGVQMELSIGVRRTFFRSLKTRVGRQVKKQEFFDFVAAVRRVIA